MAALGDLFARLGLDIGGFQKGVSEAIGLSVKLDDELSEVEKASKKLSQEFEKNIRALASSMQSVGTTLTASVTAPLAALSGISVKFAADFELGMRQVTSLLGQTSTEADKTFREMGDSLLDLSKRLGIDAVKAAQALYEAISAGIPKENALSFLEVASKAAIAGVTDTKVAVDGLTNIMNAYGIAADRATEVSDAMFQSVNIGKVTFAQLASSVGIASGLASQLGVDFKELLGAMATITKQGRDSAEAFTMIRSAMVAMISPNKEMNDLFQKLGVSSGAALIQANGLQGALVKLREAAGGSEQKLSDAMGRVEGLGAALALTGKNAAGAATDIKSVKDSAGAAELAFQELEKTTTRQFEKLKANAQAAAIEFGKSLQPAINGLLSSLNSLAQELIGMAGKFNALDPPTRGLVVTLGGLAAAVGPVTLGLGKALDLLPKLGNVFALVASPAGLAVAAIAGLGAAFFALRSDLERLGEVEAQFSEALRLRTQIEETAGALSLLGDEINMQAGEGWPEYIARLRELKGELLSIPQLAKDFQIAIQSGKPVALMDTGTFQATFAQAAAAMKTGAELAQDLKLAQASAEASMKAWADRVREAGPAWANVGREAGLALKIVKEEAPKAAAATGEIGKAGKKAAKDLQETREAFDKQFEKMGKAYSEFWTSAARNVLAGLDPLNEALGKGLDVARRFASGITDIPFDAFIQMKVAAQDAGSAMIELANRTDAAAIRFSAALKAMASLDLKSIPQQLSSGTQSVSVLSAEFTKLQAALKSVGASTKEDLVDRVEQARQNYLTLAAARQRGEVEYSAVIQAQVKLFEAQQAAGQQLSKEQIQQLASAKAALGENVTKIQEVNDAWGKMGVQVSTILTDLGKDLAKGILQAKSFADAFMKAANAIKEAFLRTLIEQAFAPFKKALDGIMEQVGRFIGQLLGFGRAASAVSAAAGGAGQAAGGAAGAAGGAGGAAGGAASGLVGAVGAVAGAVNAVFGALSFFQGRRMEQDIARIEVSTRELLNGLVLNGDAAAPMIKQSWQALQYISDRWDDYLGQFMPVVFEKLDHIADLIESGSAPAAGAATPQVFPGSPPSPILGLMAARAAALTQEQIEEFRRQLEESQGALPPAFRRTLSFLGTQGSTESDVRTGSFPGSEAPTVPGPGLIPRFGLEGNAVEEVFISVGNSARRMVDAMHQVADSFRETAAVVGATVSRQPALVSDHMTNWQQELMRANRAREFSRPVTINIQVDVADPNARNIAQKLKEELERFGIKFY